jgi:hypothetical protein
MPLIELTVDKYQLTKFELTLPTFCQLLFIAHCQLTFTVRSGPNHSQYEKSWLRA